MSPYTLGRAMCVCRKWRYSIRHCSALWQSACLKAWQTISYVENARICLAQYEGNWRKMYLERPRLRTDGIYVSRNTYVKAGLTEWTSRKSVHIVSEVGYTTSSFVNTSMNCKCYWRVSKWGLDWSCRSAVSFWAVLRAFVSVGATTLISRTMKVVRLPLFLFFISFAALILWELSKRVSQRDGRSRADCEMKWGRMPILSESGTVLVA
jgi:hypothetical protein